MSTMRPRCRCAPPMLDGEAFTACRDDLRECPFIADPSRPWPSRPDLDAGHHVDSGVFHAPAGPAPFFERCLDDALDDGQ